MTANHNKPPGPKSQSRIKWLTHAILVIGFGSAIIIYIAAGSPPANPMGYEPLDSKRYVHDLEVYGGTANVLAEEFRNWFASLWHGRKLAFTVAVITVLVVLAVRFFTIPLPPAHNPDDGAQTPRGPGT